MFTRDTIDTFVTHASLVHDVTDTASLVYDVTETASLVHDATETECWA